jgi:hypothetical protein
MKPFLTIVYICGTLLVATALPAFAYAVRGEAEIAGNGVPADCPQVGTRFSAVLQVPNLAQCRAHAACTAAKVTPVNSWIAQLNQRNRGHCVGFVHQSTNHCSLIGC